MAEIYAGIPDLESDSSDERCLECRVTRKGAPSEGCWTVNYRYGFESGDMFLGIQRDMKRSSNEF